MTKEEIFYLQILNDHLNNKKTSFLEEIDFKRLFEIGISQNTSGIIYNQIKNFVPVEYKDSFNRIYMSEIYNYGNRIHITKEIEEVFKENNINYFLVKGPVLSQMYPIPSLRTMGDSDFVVEADKVKLADELLVDLGFKCIASSVDRAYIRNNMEVEIHDRLIYKGNATEISFSNRMWDYVEDNKLNDSYHFVFLLLHLKKHILEMGIGFRQFMDLYVMKNKTELDYSFINSEIDKLGLNKFYDTCNSLINCWFEDTESIFNDKNITEITESIFKNGVHGFENEENDTNLFFNEINDGKISSKIKYMFNLYFPSYEYFIKDDNYKFLIGKKYLLPIAWIYRYYLSIKNNNVLWEIKRSFKSFFMSKKEIENKKNRFDKWGL